MKDCIDKNLEPDELIKEIIQGNRIYSKKNTDHFSQLCEGQKPDITLVTCCDSRIPNNIFNLDTLNEIFIIRNIGNQFRRSEGSIKYSILHLKTSLLIIMGHTGCGAINASLSDYRSEDDAIQEEVIGLLNSIALGKEREIEKKHDNDEIIRNSMYAEANVDYQIDKIVKERRIKPLVDNKQLYVIGMMFDIHGIYTKDKAKIYIINLNGEKDLSKIAVNKLFSKVDKKILDDHIKRLH